MTSSRRTTLELTPTRRLVIEADRLVLTDSAQPDARCAHPAHPLLERAGPLVHATSGVTGTTLVGRARAEAVFRIDAALSCERVPLEVERLAHSAQTALHAVAEGFLVITENGILGLDHAAATRWRIDCVSAGWRYVGESEGAMHLSDAHGNLIAVDPTTGEETDA